MIKNFSIDHVLDNLEALEKNEEQLKMMKSYARNFHKQFVVDFGLSWLRLEAVNEIVSETIITNSPAQLEVGFAYMVWTNRQAICDPLVNDL